MAACSARACLLQTVLPAAIAAIIATPFGTWRLKKSDPIVRRWIMCVALILILGLRVSGWLYRGYPAIATSAGVGGIAGLFAGTGQMSRLPVIALSMRGSATFKIIRANIFLFLSVRPLAIRRLLLARTFLYRYLFLSRHLRAALWRSSFCWWLGVLADELHQLPATDLCPGSFRGHIGLRPTAALDPTYPASPDLQGPPCRAGSR